ncbi:hypothetical protein DFJ77DRAFT_458028 [Powellomyces hirtus]|nr:hypothetical protein DFJ77DRAFT_458028 [Powellomyces hirtus]
MTTHLPVVGKLYSVRLSAEQVLAEFESCITPMPSVPNSANSSTPGSPATRTLRGPSPIHIPAQKPNGRTCIFYQRSQFADYLLLITSFHGKSVFETGTVPHLSAEQLSELLLAVEPTPTPDPTKHAIKLTTPLNGGYVILEPIPVRVRKIWKAWNPESAVTTQDLIYLRECVKSYEDRVWRASLPVPPTSSESGIGGGGATGANGSNEAGADEERGEHDGSKRKIGDDKDDSSKRPKADDEQLLDDDWSDSDDDDEVTFLHAPLVDLYEDLSSVYEEEGLTCLGNFWQEAGDRSISTTG